MRHAPAASWRPLPHRFRAPRLALSRAGLLGSFQQRNAAGSKSGCDPWIEHPQGVTMSMNTFAAAALVAVLAVARSGSAQAQPPNLEKLKQFKVSGTDLNIPTVPQTGKTADALRENLKKVKLPPGF